MFKHILLPTDGSDAALRAVVRGAELAVALGAEVTVMTAVEHFPAGIMGSAYRPDDDELHQAARDAAARRLGAAEEAIAGLGLTVHRVLTQERTVYQAILEAAKTSGADLIVMGTHGLGAIERLLVGSQTQRVLAHTNLPVLVLH